MKGKDWKCKKGKVTDGVRFQMFQERGENRITGRGGGNSQNKSQTLPPRGRREQ